MAVAAVISFDIAEKKAIVTLASLFCPSITLENSFRARK